MTDNNTTNLHTTASPFKLKNPTKYHLLATQQQQQGQQQLDETTSLTHVRRPSFVDPLSVMESQPMEFTDSYTQQFLSPISNSSPLQDFDDMESISATGGRQIMMIQPNYYPHFTEGSPSDYSSSVDVFSNHSHPSSYLTEYYNRNQQQDSLSTTTMTASPTMIYYPNNNSNNNRLSMSSVGGGDPHQQVSSSPPQQQPFSAPAHMGYDFMGHMSNLYHHQPQQQSPLTMNRKNSDTTTVTTTLNTLSSSLSTSNAGHHSLEEYESFQLNQQLLLEKKRRRRESHNAVERRRRENINERIQELGTMLPETMLEELASNGSTGTNNKPNKGAILRKSVDHIRLLQQEVSSHKQRIFELERQLAGLTTNAVSNKTNSTPTAATATTLTHTTAMSL